MVSIVLLLIVMLNPIKRAWNRWRFRRIEQRLDRERRERERVEQYDDGEVTLGVLAYEVIRDLFWRMRWL